MTVQGIVRAFLRWTGMVDGSSLGSMGSVTSSENQRDHEGHKGDTGITVFSTKVFVKKTVRDWPDGYGLNSEEDD